MRKYVTHCLRTHINKHSRTLALECYPRFPGNGVMKSFRAHTRRQHQKLSQACIHRSPQSLLHGL